MKIPHSDRVFEGCQRFGMHLQVYRKWKWMFVNARLSASYLCQATIYLLYSIPSATYLRQEEINFGRILEIVSNLKDAANSFGAPRLVPSCEAFRICYKNDNIEGFVHCQKHLKNDFLCLKKTLKAFFQQHTELKSSETIEALSLVKQKDPMETVEELLKRHADLVNYMYREEIVDSQFITVLNMRALDENLENPDFFGMMVAVFREASDAKLETAASELQKEDPNYERIDRIIEDFRETSIWCVRCFKRLEDEYLLIKSRLETLLQLEHQIDAAGAIIPVIELPTNKVKRPFNPK
ncbi:hypothetical protein ACET3Z_007119 [Daucus carota]